MDVKEVTIGEGDKAQTYRIGKISGYNQVHLTRRLAPVMMAFGEGKVPMKEDGTLDLGALGAMLMALRPVAEVLAKLSDAEAEYVMDGCLAVVQRRVGDQWVSVKVRGSTRFQFEDIEMPEILQLVFHVIVENLGRFFPEPPASK